MKLKQSQIAVAASFAAVAVPATSEAKGQEDQRPNIVVIIADDISFNDIGCYGNPVVKTPNIDALANAQGGMRFMNTFLTTSSSSPSRSSIITGRYPHNTGACELHSPIGPEQVSVAGILQDAGYHTAHAGKWHFGASYDAVDAPFDVDFDVSGGQPKGVTEITVALEDSLYMSRLQNRPKDKPFFMWFAPLDAHRPWDNDKSLPRYDTKDIVVSKYYVDDERTRKDIANYYYEITRFDHSVGTIVEELKRQGVYDNTMVVVMADNGRPFPHAKTRLIADGIKTFFVVSYPNAIKQKAQLTSSLVSVIDLAPTMLDLADVKAPKSFQGKSFAKLFAEPSMKFRNYVFAEHNWHNYESLERMVCDGRYLLIENRRPNLNAVGASDIIGTDTGLSLKEGFLAGTLTQYQMDMFAAPRPEVLLFDMATDVDQEYNLVRDYPSLTEKMMSKLRKWQKQTADTYPEHITIDNCDRFTVERSETVRGEMPGASAGATTNKNSGPF